MPSCSRIARRCGDVEARTIGGAGDALTACARPRSPHTASAAPTRPGRASRPAAAAAPPRESTCADPPRWRRRAPSARGRTTRRAAARARPAPGPALTRFRPRPSADAGIQLRRRRVDADDTRTALHEPRREVGGAATELDDVEAGDVTEDAHLRGGTPNSPHVISSFAHAAAAERSV